MSKIEESVSSNLKTVRNEARLMGQQIKSETGQRLQALQNRVTGVESIQREHGEEDAKLRNELAEVRQELTSVKEENTRQVNQITSQIEQAQQSTRNDLSGLDRRLSSNQTAVSALGYQVGRKRIDFELKDGHTQQVVDGIYVTVKKTDVERQRVDGWVQIARDGRFVWLHGQGAQNPIDFSSRADARPYQLVFTQVGRRENAKGYVLVPMTSEASAAANPKPAPEPLSAYRVVFGNGMALVGLELQPDREALRWKAEWMAERDLAEDYAVYLHFVDKDGRMFPQDHRFVFNGRGTRGLRQGEKFTEEYVIPLTSEIRNAPVLQVGVYEPSTLMAFPVLESTIPVLAQKDGIVLKVPESSISQR
jgi:hypothetical protein